jgi:hypothetical protein
MNSRGPPPVVRCFLLMAQFREMLLQLFCWMESPLMIIDLPSYDPDHLPDD